MTNWKTLITVAVALMLTGCASMTAINHIPKGSDDEVKKLVVFLDGTANDEGSHTNIAKLNNLVSLQSRNDIRTTYIKGVGTDGKIIGMAMGWGIGHDIREAYLFLAENYNEKRGDEVYIFGFSRGAYAARILSALIHVAGIQDTSDIKGKKEKYEYVEKIYKAYKGEKPLAQRKKDVEEVIGHYPVSQDIEFMGLWDTVEALGVPDYKEDWKVPNARYEDQLCNINSAVHALSVDDDRARIFTPILLTNSQLISECKNKNIDAIVEEVWFSGAHADVGGGYSDTDISGVSLNWMLNKIKKYSIVPSGSAVYSDYTDLTHDPESGVWGLIYRKRNRDLYSYAQFNGYNNKKLKIHKSVIDRLRENLPKNHEYQWADSEYKDCFVREPKGLRYIEASDCFDVVE
jgi:uncharacterized protein (DUF2235 family)